MHCIGYCVELHNKRFAVCVLMCDMIRNILIELLEVGDKSYNFSSQKDSVVPLQSITVIGSWKEGRQRQL